MADREIPKPAPTMWFVAFKFNRWANCETSVSIPFATKMDDGSVGFMPVYETADDAAKANPGCIVKAVRAPGGFYPVSAEFHRKNYKEAE